MLKIAVLVSGSGSNLQAIIDNIKNKTIDCKVSYVVADRNCGGLERALNNNINGILLDYKQYGANLSTLIHQLLKNKVNLIVLAGFLSILDTEFINSWNKKIINIHPSLLPKYGGKGMYGIRVHNAVIANKETQSGCTVHYVDNGIDTGEIILQQQVAVLKTDTPQILQQKILAIEHQVFIQAIKKIIS